MTDLKQGRKSLLQLRCWSPFRGKGSEENVSGRTRGGERSRRTFGENVWGERLVENVRGERLVKNEEKHNEIHMFGLSRARQIRKDV